MVPRDPLIHATYKLCVQERSLYCWSIQPVQASVKSLYICIYTCMYTKLEKCWGIFTSFRPSFADNLIDGRNFPLRNQPMKKPTPSPTATYEEFSFVKKSMLHEISFKKTFCSMLICFNQLY